MVLLVLCLVLSVVQAFVLVSFKFNLVDAFIDSTISNIILSLFCFETINILKYYQPGAQNYAYRFAIGFVLTFLSIYITRWLLCAVFVNDVGYQLFFENSFYIRFVFSFLIITTVTLISWLWYYFDNLQQANSQKTDAENLLREAELTKLRQQLQPHFLFNSLNSINALVGAEPKAARKMIQQLSDFLRGTLKKDEQQFLLFQDEITHLNLYLEIEKVRFGARLQTEIKVNDGALLLKLPPMILQPLVENAIKFGLYNTTEDVLITIQVEVIKGYLQINIMNPYNADYTSNSKASGFGLSIVQRRLFLLYSRNDLLQTHGDKNIFYTSLKIPQA